MNTYSVLFWHPENEEPEYINVAAPHPEGAEEACRELFKESKIRIMTINLKGVAP